MEAYEAVQLLEDVAAYLKANIGALPRAPKVQRLADQLVFDPECEANALLKLADCISWGDLTSNPRPIYRPTEEEAERENAAALASLGVR